MRGDTSLEQNGSSVSNGSKSSLHRSNSSNATNGSPQQQKSSNGISQNESNGTSTAVRPPTSDYYGHDREEVTRLLIQSLNDLGYNSAATALSNESGYNLETANVAAFRHSVLHGEWAEAEALLFGRQPPDAGGGVSLENGHSNNGLTLAEGADKNEMLFWMRQQKFLELLEIRDLPSAIMVLRLELTPLHQDIHRLHALSSLIMCQSAEDLRSHAEWDGAEGNSRHLLLGDLSRCVAPWIMIPEHRLADLLHQVKQSQISNCFYHNTAAAPSLYADHSCDKNLFPLKPMIELDKSGDEVWFVAFSHDGTRLAATGKDKKVIVYNTDTWEVIHRLGEHEQPTAYVSWSPDDTRMVTVSSDHRAKIWDAASGLSLCTLSHSFEEPVTSCAWSPDGNSFVIGSFDKKIPLSLWNPDGDRLYSFSGEFRCQDFAISPDGRRLVAISNQKQIIVYDFITREELYQTTLRADLTCVTISSDSKHMLINLSDSEIQLLEIETAKLVQRYLGQKQGSFVIRSTFGGAGENFVVSGSEDTRIYIWRKESGTPVEILDAHTNGCVNSIAWNPVDPSMFASAGDDRKVIIWSRIPTVPSHGWEERARLQ